MLLALACSAAPTASRSAEPAPQLPPASRETRPIERDSNGHIVVAPDAATATPAAGVPPRLGIINPFGPRTLRVGPDQALKLPSAAAALAANSDTVEIEPGTYADCAVWRANHLSILGLGAGAVFAGKSCAGKGIFVIAGDDVTVRNITFSNAKVPDGNGAGIRAEGRNLTIEDSHFLNNQDGILTAPSTGSLIVRRSSFIGNGVCNPSCAHGIYAGAITLLRVEHSSFFETKEGHHIKSRALTTEIYDNSIRDGATGTSSYLVELPNGGNLVMRNNALEKGPRSENQSAAVSIGAEGKLHPASQLLITGNSFENDMPVKTAFVKNQTPTPAVLEHNSYKGRIVPLIGPGRVADAVPAASYSDQLQDLYGALKEGLKQQIKSAAANSPRGAESVQKTTTEPNVEAQAAEAPAAAPQIADPARIGSLAKIVAGMAPGSWHEIPNSSITPVLSRRDEAPNNGAVDGPQAVIIAWTGSAYDDAGHKWYFFGGGHGDYSGNEVYEFDLETLKWRRLTRPSPLQPATPGVRCPMPVDGPSSSHTYDGITFSPPTKTFFVWPAVGYCAGAMLYSNGSWEFNPETLKWSRIPDGPVLGIFSDYDPNSGKIVLMRNGVTAYFDPVHKTYIAGSMNRGGPGDFGMGVVVPERKEYWGIDYNRTLFKIALSPDAPGPVEVVSTAKTLPPDIGSSTGVAWSSKLKRLVYWGGERAITMLDPATLKWSIATIAPGRAPSAMEVPNGGIYSKWKYVADLEAFIGYCNPNHGVWVYRPMPQD